MLLLYVSIWFLVVSASNYGGSFREGMQLQPSYVKKSDLPKWVSSEALRQGRPVVKQGLRKRPLNTSSQPASVCSLIETPII